MKRSTFLIDKPGFPNQSFSDIEGQSPSANRAEKAIYKAPNSFRKFYL